MRSTRLLVVVPAAAALVLTGLSPAAAHDGDRHHDKNGHNGDIEASVDEIGGRAHFDEDDEEVRVAFRYDCEDGDDDHIKAHVKLEQDDSLYEGWFKLACDVDDRWVAVWLDEEDNDLDVGEDAEVTVTLYDDDDKLDEKSRDDVKVRDADHDGH
jgi:hypothetical protein